MQQVQTVAAPPVASNDTNKSSTTRQPDRERRGEDITFLVVFSAPWRRPAVQIK